MGRKWLHFGNHRFVTKNDIVAENELDTFDFDTDSGVSACVFGTNFGQLYYYDKTADDAERHVEIIPLYALSNL